MLTRDREVEVRAFISQKDFKRLKKSFDKKAKFLNHHRDETLYFDKDGRLRLRREKKCDYLIYKFGKIHDRHRQEMEIKIEKPDFDKIKKILEILGLPLVVIWNRERLKWSWRGFQMYLDNTRGYGRIFEIEAMVAKKDKEKAYRKILELFKELNIKPTPKKEMQKQYRYYLKNWRRLI